LDRELNLAIHHITSRLLPTGFDVSENAPATFEGLIAHLDNGKRMVVFSGGSTATIYADPDINYAFRAWHDFCHWRGEHDLSLDGEAATCLMQCRHLRHFYSNERKLRRWSLILRAEVIGQGRYFHYHKHFPANQRGFVEAYLNDASQALRWSLW